MMNSSSVEPFELAMSYVEDETGRRISIRSVANIMPLSYENLLDVIGSQGVIKVPIDLKGVPLIDSANPSDVEQGAFNVSCVLESHSSTEAIGIVRGGWLPSSLAAQNRTLLLDRCVVSKIYEYFRDGARPVGPPKDFIDLLDIGPVRLNPLLYALEGNKKTHLSSNEVRSQIEEACEKIQQVLPNAIIQPNADNLWCLASSVIERTCQGFEKKTSFLKAIAPKLASPIAYKNRDIVWAFVVEQQKKFGVDGTSIIMWAVLSAIFCEQNSKNPLANPARKLFKFRKNYTDSIAYNALSDLRAIELYAILPSLFVGERFAFCTTDTALAAFAVGLDPYAIAQISSVNPIVKCSAEAALFPDGALKRVPAGNYRL